jgi:methylenetetrahydrofolate dehydrogenase (NADP+)/methenyltetrahydrofolate cyclohydrolase
MPAQLIDGKAIAEDIEKQVRAEVVKLPFTPGLAVFMIGDDEASQVYIKLKEKACKKVGIDFHKYVCSDKTCLPDVVEAIKFLNKDEHIDAILVQLPLPAGFDEQEVIDTMDPAKDVDGFHPQTLKKFLGGQSDFIPGLSLGIIRLIESTKEKVSGKRALIIANSDIFAAPLKKLLEDRKAEVIVLSPDDKKLAATSQQADIVVIAIGRPNFLKKNMIKPGAILIDVGTTRLDDVLIGDVDLKDVKDKAGFVTPVPGGVGPVTVAMLLENTVKLAKRHRK